MDKRLSVRLFGQEIGLLEQDISDRIKFTYNDDNNIPISYRLPVSKKSFTDEDCRPYFHGLLSEADSVRKYLGKIFHINPNDDFALLQAIGRDCAGAISFHNPEEPVKPDESAQLEYTLLSDNELKKNIEEAEVSLKKGYCRFLLINLEYKTETIIIANIMTKMMIILKKRTSNDLKLMEMDFKW